MITQRLYRNGNSVAVTIPKDFLENLNLKEGSEVVLDKKGEEIVISSKKTLLVKDLDPNFVKIVDEFIENHKDVLEELARR